MRTSETLRAARDLIADPAKWWDGRGSREGDGICAEMALRDAQGIRTGWTETHRAFCRAVGLPAEFNPAGIFDWNDASGRTHAEVLAAFDTAISYAEAAEQEFSPSACAPVDSIAGHFAKAHEVCYLGHEGCYSEHTTERLTDEADWSQEDA